MIDAAARGLAATALKQSATILSRAQRYLRSASYPSVMATAPVVTQLAAFNTSTIANSVFVPITDARIYGHASSRWPLVVTAAINDGVQRGYYTGPAAVAGSPTPLTCGFVFDGPQLDILLYGNPGQAYSMQMLVDGQLQAATYATNAGTGGNTRFILSWVFPTRALRSIYISFAQAGVAGFFIGPQDTIAPPADIASVLSMSFVGDSYLAAGPGTDSPNGLGASTALRLGTPLFLLDGVGGSGYTARNSGVSPTSNNFVDRQSGAAQQSFPTPIPDIHVTMGGINDASPLSPTQVSGYYQTLRGWFPNTILVATGPWCPDGTLAPVASGSKYPAIRDVIKAGIATVAGPWVFIDNLTDTWVNSSGASGRMTDGNPWQTGNGFNAASTGPCTISIASPAVITYTNNFKAGQPVRFTTTGALPTGLTAGTVYYVSATGLSTSSFQVSATNGGASVNTSGTQSGTQTITGGTGVGNSDFYVVQDGTHPPAIGVDYLSKRLAANIRAAVLAL